jgi:hypothetical protein
MTRNQWNPPMEETINQLHTGVAAAKAAHDHEGPHCLLSSLPTMPGYYLPDVFYQLTTLYSEHKLPPSRLSRQRCRLDNVFASIFVAKCVTANESPGKEIEFLMEEYGFRGLKINAQNHDNDDDAGDDRAGEDELAIKLEVEHNSLEVIEVSSKVNEGIVYLKKALHRSLSALEFQYYCAQAATCFEEITLVHSEATDRDVCSLCLALLAIPSMRLICALLNWMRKR